MKFKKGDTILITAGKDKGKSGKIEKIYPPIYQVLIPGINLFKKHLKKQGEKSQGGIIDFPRPLESGKFVLLCPACKKPTRVGFSLSHGEKIRICRKCEKPV